MRAITAPCFSCQQPAKGALNTPISTLHLILQVQCIVADSPFVKRVLIHKKLDTADTYNPVMLCCE